MGLSRMARLPLPRLDINHSFKEVPVHYHGAWGGGASMGG